MTDIHLGDVGTIFEVVVQDAGTPLDISANTEILIIFQKPDGTPVSKTAVFSTDGTDGKMRYVSVTDDLDQIGGWKLQGKITLPAWTGKTGTGEFEVAKNL